MLYCYFVIMFIMLCNVIMLFFLFLVVFNNFFRIPVEIENVRLRLALAISTGVLITVANCCNRNAATCCR